jgi:hypothetical protein
MNAAVVATGGLAPALLIDVTWPYFPGYRRGANRSNVIKNPGSR